MSLFLERSKLFLRAVVLAGEGELFISSSLVNEAAEMFTRLDDALRHYHAYNQKEFPMLVLTLQPLRKLLQKLENALFQNPNVLPATIEAALVSALPEAYKSLQKNILLHVNGKYRPVLGQEATHLRPAMGEIVEARITELAQSDTPAQLSRSAYPERFRFFHPPRDGDSENNRNGSSRRGSAESGYSDMEFG